MCSLSCQGILLRGLWRKYLVLCKKQIWARRGASVTMASDTTVNWAMKSRMAAYWLYNYVMWIVSTWHETMCYHVEVHHHQPWATFPSFPSTRCSGSSLVPSWWASNGVSVGASACGVILARCRRWPFAQSSIAEWAVTRFYRQVLSMSTSSGRGGACRVYGHMNNEHIYHKCTVCQKRDAWKIYQATGAHPNTQRTSTYSKCKVFGNGWGPFPSRTDEMVWCCKLRIRNRPKPNNLMHNLGSFFASLGPDTLTSKSLRIFL